jgi:hypothetical protein
MKTLTRISRSQKGFNTKDTKVTKVLRSSLVTFESFVLNRVFAVDSLVRS